MRCHEHRRADLHSSQIDDLKDHLVKTKTPRPDHSYCSGYHRVVPPQLPNPATTRYNPIHPNIVLRKALTDQTLSAGAACTWPNLPGLQTVHNADRPGAVTTATLMLPPLRLGFRAHHYYFDQFELNGNPKRSTPRPRRRRSSTLPPRTTL
jgi:hypothetical protein